jgi:hypothetical protein
MAGPAEDLQCLDMQGRPHRRGRAGVVLIVAMLTALVGFSGAARASAPIALDGPQNGNDPLVVYDPVGGATFVAWSDPQGSVGGIELCVLPNGASRCAGGAPVLLNVSAAQNPVITGDNTIGLGGLVVLPGGNVVVIGTPVSNSSVAWESTPDGASFESPGQGLQNGGGFISPVSLFYTFGNAVGLSATDVGLLDDYGDYFSDSPYAGPESPAILAPNSNQGNGGLYPRKAQDTSGSEIGAEPAPAPAALGTEIVVGVGDNFAGPNTTLPGCVNSAGTGYGASVGAIGGAPGAIGTLNTDGMSNYVRLACSAANPVIASGGADGMGVLENEGSGISGAGSSYSLDYRPFVATQFGGGFGGPVQLAKLTGAADDVDVVDDAGTGVYAMWSEDGLHLDYSADGGKTWDGAVVVPEPKTGVIDDPVIAGVSHGDVLLAFDNNPGPGDETFLEDVNANPTPAPALPSTGTTTSGGASFTITCAPGSTCAGTSTIIVPKLTPKAAVIARAKTIVLGKVKFSIKAGTKGLVKVRLNKAGKRLVAADHGHFTAKVLIADRFEGHTLDHSRTLTFKPAKGK